MKRCLIILLIATGLESCNSKESSFKNRTKFDLSNISFNESVQDISAASGTKLTDSISQEKTLFGYERVETNSPQVLNYDGTSLSGTAAGGTNKVIIHYAEASKKVALYELRIYTEKQNADLIALINKKVGKAAVEKSMKDDGTGTNFKQVVWHKGDVIYLLLQELGNGTTVKTSNLAVFKNNNKDFYTLLGQKGYAINPKGLVEEAFKKITI